MKLSVVSPVYKAELIVDELVRKITEGVTPVTDDYEIILVEDGSPDKSWDRINENCRKNSKVKGVKLSRNFGQHQAITAGIDIASGDYVVVMDCDLQDDPLYIKDLVNKSKEGFDIVYTVKSKRSHNFFKNITTLFFNRIFNYLVDNDRLAGSGKVGSYSLLTRKAVVAFRKFNDYQRHYLSVLRWIGYSHAFIEVQHKPRFEGKSSYNWSKLISHAIIGITSQSDKLLRLNITIGFLLSTISFLAAITVVIMYFAVGFKSGWASLIITMFFTLGVTLTSLGIVGIYIGKIFEQVKNRPRYLIDQEVNL